MSGTSGGILQVAQGYSIGATVDRYQAPDRSKRDDAEQRALEHLVTKAWFTGGDGSAPMNDTTPEVREKMIQIIALLSPQQRLEKSGGLFASGKQLAEIAVRRRAPHLEGLDLKLAVFRVMYQSVLSGKFLDDIEQHARAEAVSSRGEE